MTDTTEIRWQIWGFRPRQQRRNWSGRLRRRPTTGNINIEVLGVDIAISGSRSLSQSLANLLSSWTSSEMPNLALEFRRYLSEFIRCNHFRLWGPYRYVRLSVAVI